MSRSTSTRERDRRTDQDLGDGSRPYSPDTTRTEKASAKQEEDVARARRLRLSRGETQESGHDSTAGTGKDAAKEKSDGTH